MRQRLRFRPQVRGWTRYSPFRGYWYLLGTDLIIGFSRAYVKCYPSGVDGGDGPTTIDPCELVASSEGARNE